MFWYTPYHRLKLMDMLLGFPQLSSDVIKVGLLPIRHLQLCLLLAQWLHLLLALARFRHGLPHMSSFDCQRLKH
jgi:hypothetical protein